MRDRASRVEQSRLRPRCIMSGLRRGRPAEMPKNDERGAGLPCTLLAISGEEDRQRRRRQRRGGARSEGEGWTSGWGRMASAQRHSAENAEVSLCGKHQRRTCVSAEFSVPTAHGKSAPRAPVQGPPRGHGVAVGAEMEATKMEHAYRVFVGIDWAETAHEVWVTDGHGNLVAHRQVPHKGEALTAMADWLIELAGGQADAVAVAIETPHGPVVDTLLDREAHVFSINPKQLDRFRDRFSPGGADLVAT
jgi:hypothetical protein